MSDKEKRPLTAEDLYELQLVSDPQISPDGEYVLFGLMRVDRKTEKKFSNLWVVPTDGGEPRQFTYGDHSDTHPRWSPDGTEIAFLSNRKDEKQMQIYIIPFWGGEARPVTKAEGSFAGFEWSPDGTTFVSQFRKKDETAVEREKDEQKKKLGIVSRHITSLRYKGDGMGYLPEEKWHIWTFDAQSGEGTQLTDGDKHEGEPHWSPDGSQILFASNRHDDPELNPEAVEMYLIPAEGGDFRVVETGHVGGKFSMSFSPDGQHIAYLGRVKPRNWYQNSCIYVVPVENGEARNITVNTDLHLNDATLGDTKGGTPQPAPIWSNDGKLIFNQITKHGTQSILHFNVETAAYETVVDNGETITGFSFSADQTKMAFAADSMTHVEELYFRDADGSVTQLTNFNDELFGAIEWGEIEEVWVKGADDNDLQGWILKPPGFDSSQKYPSILEIHGGPMAQYGRSFMHEFHYLAAQGYVVYYTNPRGGHGYGQDHLSAIVNNWATVDYADLMAWTDYVEKLPYIDTERMGVTGGSYGGYMTTLIIGKTHRFKAAVAQRLVSNFLSFYGSSDMNWGTEGLIGTETQPWNDFEGYWRQSPISTIGNAKTPTLVIHSEMDYRCDREQGEQVFVALKRMGVDSEMVLFPGESHGLSRNGRTDRRIERLSHIARWFETYL